MSQLFLKIVNMSISASWLVLAVLLLRLLLKKAPKWISVLLWGFVAVRLICPFTVESTLSLIPSEETIRPEIMMDRTPEVDTGIGSLNGIINPVITEAFQPQELTSINPLQIWIPLAALLWLTGIAAMLLYTAISYLLLRRKVATAVRLRDNIFQSENVATPFVLGIIKPKIYLPFQMEEKNLAYVIAHEEAHIRRKDHWWKPLGFILLAIHWFNPLMWLGYILLCRDIELACDEKVIKTMDGESRADYTQALVACSISRRSIAACPLAFGEVSVKNRIKSVMNYKKPAFWIIIAAVIICIVVAVCFLTDPAVSVDESLSVFIDCRIAEHFQTEKTAGRASCVNWKVLGAERDGKETTVYMWVLYEEYSLKDSALYCEIGAHIPTAITAKKENSGWQLVEYWEPRDGGYYESDIKEKFPTSLWWKALDSQRYIDQQQAENRITAWEYFVSESQMGGAGMTPTWIGPAPIVDAGAIDENGNWVTKPKSKLDGAIASAIFDRAAGTPAGMLRVESHMILAFETVSDEPLPGGGNHFQETTAFVYYMSLLFDPNAQTLDQPDGTYGYAIITFDISETGEYILKAFRDPKTSADYDTELMKRFAQASEGAAKNEKENKLQLYAHCQVIAYAEVYGFKLATKEEDLLVIDSIAYDLDGDGRKESCTITYGPTSGVFSFCLNVFPAAGEENEETYRGTYVLIGTGVEAPGELSFHVTKENLQLKAVEESYGGETTTTVYFDLMLLQGEVVLCQVN